jgi:hypothetical protein
MISRTLQYRGVNYDAHHHDLPSDVPVAHVYRGSRYQAALRHEPAAVDERVVLHYRGATYHHHRPAAGGDGTA